MFAYMNKFSCNVRDMTYVIFGSTCDCDSQSTVEEGKGREGGKKGGNALPADRRKYRKEPIYLLLLMRLKNCLFAHYYSLIRLKK